MKSVSKVVDIPKEKHYAIITQSSYYEAPYDKFDSGGSVDYLRYEYTLDKKEWISEVEKRTKTKNKDFYSNNDFIAMEVTPAKITVSIGVEIE